MGTKHPASFSPGRKWQVGLSVFVSTASVLALVFMANYLAVRHYWRWDLSRHPRLSPLTVRVLGSLTNTVKVIVFFDRSDPLFSPVSQLLNQFSLQCPKLEIQYVDYRLPGRATAIQAQYPFASGSDGNRNRIIFDSNGNRKIIMAQELSVYDTSEILRGGQPRRTGFKGELLFTSAIFNVVDSRVRKAYFLQGHGEHNPENTGEVEGYSQLAALLEKENNVQIARLDPLVGQEIPKDCQLLIVGGARASLRPEELDKIEKYIQRGGRIFLLFRHHGPGLKPTGLEHLAATLNVEVGQNIVQDSAQARAESSGELIVTKFGSHPLINPLLNSAIDLLRPRSISQKHIKKQSAETPKVDELAFTGPDGMTLVPAKNDVFVIGTRGSIPLVVAVEKGGIQGVNGDPGAARLVIVGDSEFLGNTVIDFAANAAFANLAINWLLDRDLLLADIGPRPVKEYQLIMSRSQTKIMRWVFLAVFPGVVLLMGFVVWARRRS